MTCLNHLSPKALIMYQIREDSHVIPCPKSEKRDKCFLESSVSVNPPLLILLLSGIKWEWMDTTIFSECFSIQLYTVKEDKAQESGSLPFDSRNRGTSYWQLHAIQAISIAFRVMRVINQGLIGLFLCLQIIIGIQLIGIQFRNTNTVPRLQHTIFVNISEPLKLNLKCWVLI